MAERALEISERSGTIHVESGRLILRDGDTKELLAPVCDVASLALTAPRIAVTRGTLAAILSNGGIVVISNERAQPVGVAIPLAAHHLTAERCLAQSAMGPVQRKRAWQQVIACKIRSQATAIEASGQIATALRTASLRVKSGDRTNLEARTSQWYWRRVFNDRGFVRDRDALDQNRFLNYGYAVLRAATTRAICASGLLPQLGLHHHNRYSGVPLADDLMEPFRPIVDRIVVSMVREGLSADLLEPSLKRRIAGVLSERILVRDELRTVPDALSLLTASVAAFAAKETMQLTLPQF